MVRVPFLDLNAQYNEVKAAVDSSFAEILTNSAYVLGKYNKELEQRIADRHQVKHAIAVNSGTDALRIMMQASGILPGDEVITTAFTFVASVETIAQIGAIPVFVDIDPETYCIDPAKIEAAITPKTKAILPIHLFGQLADMKAIKAIADKHNLLIVEDAAQALFGHCDGVYTGEWGSASAISFYVTKNLGAAGDGGMILTNDDEVARRSLSLRIHGMGRERYYYDEIGYTSRMAELQAAFLVAKMARIDAWNDRRVEVAEKLLAGLANTGIGLPRTYEGNNNTWHQFTIRSDQRGALMEFLKTNEIDSGIYYPVPLHLHEPYAGYGHGEGSLPITERVSQECLSLPVQAHLSNEQVEFMIDKIQEFCRVSAGKA